MTTVTTALVTTVVIERGLVNVSFWILSMSILELVSWSSLYFPCWCSVPTLGILTVEWSIPHITMMADIIHFQKTLYSVNTLLHYIFNW